MKTITRILASLSVLLLAAACQQFEIDTQMTPEQEYANLRLVCDAVDSYSFAATNADKVTFNVSANTPWTVTRSSGADWCTVTPSSSSASSLIADVVVSVADNDSGEDRSATLTIKGERVNKYYTVTINQSRKGRLFVTPVAKDYAATGGPLSFTINTNKPWSVRSDVSWLKFSPENGQPDPDGRTITIVATAEPSDVMERTATVTVTAGDDEETFDVTQKGSFEMTAITGEFPGAGGSQALKLRTDLPWTVSADKDWVTFDKESGEGSNAQTVINVTAKPNDDAVRKAVITVTAGGEAHTFEVTQAGAAFAIIPPADPTIDSKGGELLVEVDATKSWEPKTEVPGFSVEKVDDNHFKVVAGFNNIFAPRKGQVSIVAASGATDSIEITQDTNFTVENGEVLEDGSVKLSGDKGTRVKFKDGLRCMTLVLTMGEKNFGDAGQLWVQGAIGNVNIYNQLSLDGNTRIRTDGNMADEAATSAYKSTKYSITKDELNAMSTYEYGLKPNTEDPKLLDMWFKVDGTEKISHTGNNPFYYNPDPVNYYFGFYSATSDGSWYVVKSCDLTVNEEAY
ncbi:MAG: BACON domain-containing protein [Bacteroidales bacterium]|nr:BACON domain-containing protein [Bacteroidales bacterium]